MNKVRLMVGLKTLNEARKLKRKLLTITFIWKFLDIDRIMGYRTFYDILRADIEGRRDISRPEWLQDEPYIQKAPTGWNLVGGMKFGHWVNDNLGD